MTWLRIEDSMLDHPKWRKAIRCGGSWPLLAWVRLLSWCSRNLTDGLIPADLISDVVDIERARDRRKALDGLLCGGLLALDGSGNGRLVDYLQRNPSREMVLKERERRANSQKNRRSMLPVTGHEAVREPPACSVPSPSHPLPIPSHPKTPTGSLGAAPVPVAKPKKAKPRTSVPETLEPNEATLVCESETGASVREQWAQFRDYHAQRATLSADWQASMRTWLRNSRTFAPRRPTGPAEFVSKLVAKPKKMGVDW